MARKVFISFRYSDGSYYKDQLVDAFDESTKIIDKSEDENRSDKSDETIRKYLYEKLRDSSVTIAIITPDAVNHEKDSSGNYDDWMYDEMRYSLEDRENNRCNGMIAVYTKDAENLLKKESMHICNKCKRKRPTNSLLDVDNIFRKNMLNVKKDYKVSKCDDTYDAKYDSYCSLVAFEDFIDDPEKYIDIAAEKRDNVEHYDLTKKLD